VTNILHLSTLFLHTLQWAYANFTYINKSTFTGGESIYTDEVWLMIKYYNEYLHSKAINQSPIKRSL